MPVLACIIAAVLFISLWFYILSSEPPKRMIGSSELINQMNQCAKDLNEMNHTNKLMLEDLERKGMVQIIRKKK